MSPHPLERAVVMVLDSCGAGEAPDAAGYGDSGSDTLGNVARAVGGLTLPNLGAAGLGALHPGIEGVPAAAHPSMAFGRMRPASAGKDSTTGHWEIAGMSVNRPFGLFPNGFPAELTDPIEARFGRKFLGNVAASGTAIIAELGESHLATGRPILYTSGDSVFQIACHADVMSVADLYRLCEIARRHCDEYRIGRVIARPFVGKPGNFRRTYDRKDFSMLPPGTTLLDRVSEAGMTVWGIGKTNDLFCGRGLTRSEHTEGDTDGLGKTVTALSTMTSAGSPGLIFTNLVDLDMRYGHRQDPHGYAAALERIDSWIPALSGALGGNDLLFITADHGTDPTRDSTDHTREMVPLLVAGRNAAGVDLGTRGRYSDVAATVAEGFGLRRVGEGTSFWKEVA
ncbi:MAG: phosphopentomutase [bacterium]|nr:phosphopentomutase [bacterium]